MVDSGRLRRLQLPKSLRQQPLGTTPPQKIPMRPNLLKIRNLHKTRELHLLPLPMHQIPPRSLLQTQPGIGATIHANQKPPGKPRTLQRPIPPHPETLPPQADQLRAHQLPHSLEDQIDPVEIPPNLREPASDLYTYLSGVSADRFDGLCLLSGCGA